MTKAIQNVRDFLNAGYPAWYRSALVSLERDRGYLDEAFYDWAHANWEMLVERALCSTGEFLDSYGPGSDYEARLYARVFFHDAQPTHEVVCESSDGISAIDVLTGAPFQPVTCRFDRLVARRDTWYEDEPPFDHVLLEGDSTTYVVPISSVAFVLRPVGTRPNQSVAADGHLPPSGRAAGRR